MQKTEKPGTLFDIVPERLYKPSEIAPLLLVTARTIRVWCAKSIFKNAIRNPGGRHWLIPGRDVLNHFELVKVTNNANASS